MSGLSPQDEDRRVEAVPGVGRRRAWGVSAERLVKLHRRAAEMRGNPTEPEKRLWRALSNSKLDGSKFRRHAVLPPFIADFCCPSPRLIVEVDGDTHDQSKDRLRDDLLGQRGDAVFRVTNDDVMISLDGVWEVIRSALAAPFRGGAGGGASAQAPRSDRRLHPNTSPAREGLA